MSSVYAMSVLTIDTAVVIATLHSVPSAVMGSSSETWLISEITVVPTAQPTFLGTQVGVCLPALLNCSVAARSCDQQRRCNFGSLAHMMRSHVVQLSAASSLTLCESFEKSEAPI